MAKIPAELAEGQTWRIGVIADTHNRWQPAIATLFADVNEIWHLGDVCQERVLDELRCLSDRVICVLGNNDYLIDYPLTRKEMRFGESFYLIHIPPGRLMERTDWLLHGHTHHPRNEVLAGVRWFNPGSAGQSRGSPLSVGFLTKVGSAPFRAEVVRV